MVYDNEDDGFFGLTEPERRGGPILDTPRPVAFSILELSKLLVLRCHYGFFRPRPTTALFTDTDSLSHKWFCENPVLEMLEATDVDFDLSTTLTSEGDVRAVCRDAYQGAELENRVRMYMAKIKQNAGKLGAFKIENERNSLIEFVGLAPKMYSFLVCMKTVLWTRT